tara:strand:+ start:2413 stop:3360 length:948 start_codon:yes stop_codon:yes gene_type:complete
VKHAVGIDIGGTKISAVLLRTDGQTIKYRLFSTPKHGTSAITEAISKAVTSVCEDPTSLSGIGIAAAGLIDRGSGTAIRGVNVGWENMPIVTSLTNRFQVPCILENDCNAAAWGEYQFGASKTSTSSLFITIGTGIGGGIIDNGRLVIGHNGYAGEIGHTLVAPSGPTCKCGSRGCLEAVASGTAIERNGRNSNPDGIDPDSITANTVAQAYAGGEQWALKIWADAVYHIALALVSARRLLSPDIIVVGGGVAEAGDVLISPLRTDFARLSSDSISNSQSASQLLQPSALGAMAGAIGAAALILSPPPGFKATHY